MVIFGQLHGCGVASIVYKFFDRKTQAAAVGSLLDHTNLANKLEKTKFKKRKIAPASFDQIWSTDLRIFQHKLVIGTLNQLL